MTPAPELVFEPFPPEDLCGFIEDHVSAYTCALTDAHDYQPVNCFLRGPSGEYVGGCIGFVWGRHLQIRWLWVALTLRGQGYGTRLLFAAESLAVQLGAIAATLETHNPSAKALYMRLGYKVFGVMENYPPGHTKSFLRKPLQDKAAATPFPRA